MVIPLLLILFAFDYAYAMATLNAEILGPIMEQVRSGGAALQIGKQVVILGVPLILGYAVAALWAMLARRLA
jgi:hypothetical protein